MLRNQLKDEKNLLKCLASTYVPVYLKLERYDSIRKTCEKKTNPSFQPDSKARDFSEQKSFSFSKKKKKKFGYCYNNLIINNLFYNTVNDFSFP